MFEYIHHKLDIKERVDIENAMASVAEMRGVVEATENAYNAMFDGLKLIADPEHPFSLTLPQLVRANMFYRHSDGKRYVAVQNGIVREDNFAEMMELWDI